MPSLPQARAARGQLPQGTGRGAYGYRCDPKTGKRLVIAGEAQVVRRSFRLSCCESKSNLSEKIGKTVEKILEFRQRVRQNL